MALRVGLAGLGVMGRNHLRVIQSTAGVELVSLYDPPVAGQVFGGIEVTANLDEFLNGLDYCVIAAPSVFHKEIALAAAARGVHALIEKPIAFSIEEAEEILKAFSDAKLIGAVGHLERYNPAVIALMAKLKEGILGDIYQICTSRQGPFPSRIADVGAVKDIGTHDFDLVTHIGGSPYKSIEGKLGRRSGRVHEDLMLTVGELENGIITSHVVNWLSPFKERKTIVLGAKGMLVADTLNVELSFHENADHENNSWQETQIFRGVSVGNSTKFALELFEPLKLEHEIFRDAVLTGNSERLVTLQDGFNALATAEKVLGL
jgi:UDP-N-acetylglucosamine 3-dehydrogenase